MTKTASDKELVEFMAKVLPDFDRSKVYVSDIKKVITWYNLLSKYVPELFVAPTEAPEAAEATNAEAEVAESSEASAEEAPKKAAKKETKA